MVTAAAGAVAWHRRQIGAVRGAAAGTGALGVRAGVANWP